MVIISSGNNSDKENFKLILILILTNDKAVINVAIIGIDIYCSTCKLKRAHVFYVSMEDLVFQTK